ncbi:MAG: class IV adenylate cyclase [Pyrinomonadaceae bacterium]
MEVEKKYRVVRERQELLRQRLAEVGASFVGEEFEENTLYAGAGLDPRSRVLRLRRAAGRAVLTYKERFASASAIKRQREDETRVDDPDALASILGALGYEPALVYEKRRQTWRLAGVEVVIDELPFGSFVEIEGEESTIAAAEQLLDLSEAVAEHESYPELTVRYGEKRGSVTEARFGR